MSFLAPLYALGILAISAPILWHLIRRTPRDRVRFSSLMFLTASTPKLTRKSRIDQWLLLLLRASAVIVLALAFARPFQRLEALINTDDLARDRVALVLDLSASMRRGNAWSRAREAVLTRLDELQPDDRVALFAFDDRVRPVLGFEESAELDLTSVRNVIRQRLDGLSPGWHATKIDDALIRAVGAVSDLDVNDDGLIRRQVVLISDMQTGARIDRLGQFAWPADIELVVERIEAPTANASVHPLAPDPSEPEVARVRVANAPGSSRDRYSLRWDDEGETDRGEPIPVTLPPGQSRVVRVPLPNPTERPGVLRLVDAPFEADNTAYFAPPSRSESTVLYLGDDPPDDPNRLRFYLERVFPETPAMTVEVLATARDETPMLDGLETTPLIVATGAWEPDSVEPIRRHVDEGATLLLVLDRPGSGGALGALLNVPTLSVDEADDPSDGFALWQEIDFAHPLFEPFASPQYNDFTALRFWRYRVLNNLKLQDGSEPRVLARFDTGDPAVLEQPIGRGRLIVLTTSWSPEDSQLARSTKFVPWMVTLLKTSVAGAVGPTVDRTRLYRVGEPIPLAISSKADSSEPVVRTPDGSERVLEAGATRFDETDRPGLYAFESPESSIPFAVNLDPSESRIAVQPLESLEQFGCVLANPRREAIEADRLEQLNTLQLERRQQLWRWLILTALALLIVETWLAGRFSRVGSSNPEVVPT